MELLGTTASGSKIYKNHRAEPYFSFVCTGRKTIEGRLNKGLYALVLPNDRIQVHNNDESQAVTVTVLATRTRTPRSLTCLRTNRSNASYRTYQRSKLALPRTVRSIPRNKNASTAS